ncbi:MAG: hypothetical protein OXH00_21670 [Candidatus Poribacteria bacterium]|nr:hypothetical protein [Candidatus Poribacteria bacterium]
MELSDIVVIPTLPVLIEIQALLVTVNIIRATHTSAKILFNRVDPRTSLLIEGKKAIRHYELEAVSRYIDHRVAFQHAYNGGYSIQEYEPKGVAARHTRAVYRHITHQLGGKSETETEFCRYRVRTGSYGKTDIRRSERETYRWLFRAGHLYATEDALA